MEAKRPQTMGEVLAIAREAAEAAHRERRAREAEPSRPGPIRSCERGYERER